MNNLEKWCEDLKKYWESKDIDNIINLFDENVIYYESPNEKLNSFEDVKNVWKEIKNQNTENIMMSIICKEQNKCIANFVISDYDMIYEIRLNNEGKCIYFKQWYMEI